MTANSSRTTFKIIVDGDSCPVKDVIIKAAQEKAIPVLLVASIAHELNLSGDNIQVLMVDNIPQAADIAILNHVAAGDIVVTGDFGLAAAILPRQAVPLSSRGLIYTDKNIDRLLLQRHLEAKIRRGGGKTRGPRAFTAQDRQRFEKILGKLISEKTGDEIRMSEKGPALPEG